jgi:hypothetical protein
VQGGHCALRVPTVFFARIKTIRAKEHGYGQKQGSAEIL